MALFRRKREPDFIDLGDQVAVRSDRVEEMADAAIERIMELYEEQVPAEVHEAMITAIQQRQPGLSGQEGSMLASTAKMGYAARMWEESFESIPSEVPMLTTEMATRLDEGQSLADALGDVALTLCDYTASDPNAPRSLDAIEGVGGVRDTIAEKTVVLSARVAQQTGLAAKASFPRGSRPRTCSRPGESDFSSAAARLPYPLGWI